MVKFRLLSPKRVSVGASKGRGSLKFEAKPPQIGGGGFGAIPAGLGRREAGEARGPPPGRGMRALPDPKSPRNRRKTATFGRFDRFGRFSPQKRIVLTGCVWGGGLVGVFCSPAGPAPARGASKSQTGAKKPQIRVCRNSREPEIGICAAFTPKWATPGTEGEGELWVWLLCPPSKKNPQNC